MVFADTQTKNPENFIPSGCDKDVGLIIKKNKLIQQNKGYLKTFSGSLYFPQYFC